ncbi:MAG TPA: amino acid permease [Chthoniobacterales bacterium]|nr:amino acid permease [Chthoniobacterales bacterium]
MASAPPDETQPLARKLGPFGATMAVIGGIVGAGIFVNPHLVAERVHTTPLILLAWICGGLLALIGGAIYAELAARLPVVGGQYAYLRQALHPAVGFIYGWVLLLVIQTGGMAAVAITFSRYLLVLTQWRVPEGLVAALTLALLTGINCIGVRAGSRVQSLATLAAILAIGILELFCLTGWSSSQMSLTPVYDPPLSLGLIVAFGSALTPVLFAYGGWQTSTFLAGETKDPTRTLPRALLLGVIIVILVYTSVNVVFLHVLGVTGLRNSPTPASTAMLAIDAPRGAVLISAGIAFSAFGFLAQSILTAPRVYFAMARDGLFFRKVGWVHPRTHVPVIAIALQGIWAILIALTGTYAQIINYVVAVDCTFFGLTAVCLLLLRRRGIGGEVQFQVPGHPWTTLIFVVAQWLVVISTVAGDPIRAMIGFGIALIGLPVYFWWRVKPGPRA